MGFDALTFAAAVGAAKKGGVSGGGVELDTTLSDSTKAAPADLVGQIKTTAENAGTSAENANLLAELAMPGSLKWDGSPGDKEYITLFTEENTEGRYVKLTDEVPTILYPAAIIGMNYGEGSGAEFAEIVVNENTGLMYANNLFIIVPAGGVAMDGVSLSAGVWTVAYYYVIDGIYIPTIYGSGLKIMLYSFAEEGADLGGYFEENVTEIGDTLTWDGDTTGLPVVDMSAVLVGYSLVCVSDNVPTKADVANGVSIKTVQADGTEETITLTGEEAQAGFGDDGVSVERFVVIPHDGYVIDGITFPSKGIYAQHFTSDEGVAYDSSFTIPGYTFTVKGGETLKPEHLPEALRFGYEGDVPSDTLEWDGNTEGLVTYEGLYKISDAVFTEEDAARSWSCTITQGDTKDTFTGDSLSPLNTGAWCILADSMLFVIFIAEGFPGDGFTPGVWAYFNGTTYPSKITLDGYEGFTKKGLVKIDTKYLPEGLGGLPDVTSDNNGAFLRVVDGKWAVANMSSVEDGEF